MAQKYQTDRRLELPIAMLADRKDSLFTLVYDEDADVLTVRLADETVTPARQLPAGPHVTVGFDKAKTPIGVELRRASRHWPRAQLLLLRGRLLTIPEAAKRVRRSPSTLRNQITNGKLKAEKNARGDLLVLEADLLRYVEELDPRGRPAATRATRPRRTKK